MKLVFKMDDRQYPKIWCTQVKTVYFLLLQLRCRSKVGGGYGAVPQKVPFRGDQASPRPTLPQKELKRKTNISRSYLNLSKMIKSNCNFYLICFDLFYSWAIV